MCCWQESYAVTATDPDTRATTVAISALGEPAAALAALAAARPRHVPPRLYASPRTLSPSLPAVHRQVCVDKRCAEPAKSGRAG